MWKRPLTISERNDKISKLTCGCRSLITSGRCATRNEFAKSGKAGMVVVVVGGIGGIGGIAGTQTWDDIAEIKPSTKKGNQRQSVR